MFPVTKAESGMVYRPPENTPGSIPSAMRVGVFGGVGLAVCPMTGACPGSTPESC